MSRAARGEAPYRWLTLVALLLCVPLVWPWFGGSGVGAFRMFTRLQHVRLAIAVEDADGARAMPVAELAPHLSLDARRILIAAERELAGETVVELLSEGLPDIGRLACMVANEPRARVRLEQRGLAHALPTLHAEVDCDASQR